MNLRNSVLIEKKLTISETDIVNGGEILVLIAYAVKENDDMFSFPTPQIFNQEIYSRNKNAYDQAVRDFRIQCEAGV